jgi:hypothetical protein
MPADHSGQASTSPPADAGSSLHRPRTDICRKPDVIMVASYAKSAIMVTGYAKTRGGNGDAG